MFQITNLRPNLFRNHRLDHTYNYLVQWQAIRGHVINLIEKTYCPGVRRTAKTIYRNPRPE